MHFSGDQIDGAAAARIEMRRIGLAVDIDGNQHALSIADAFPDALLIRQDELLKIAVAQGFAAAMRFDHGGDTVGQPVPFGRFE